MKKIILVIFSFFLISGVVSASSINGEYNGNPIVKVYVNGSEIRPEVPAHIVDGTTMLPMRAVAEALGADVEWESSSYTVNIVRREEPKEPSISELKSMVTTAKKRLVDSGINLTFYSVNFDEFGAYVSVGYDTGTKNQDQIINELVFISATSVLMKDFVDETVISVSGGGYMAGTISVSISDVLDFLDEKITLSQYIGKWNIKKNQQQTSNQNSLLPDINQNVTPQIPPSSAVCLQINSKYDQQKRQKQEELAERGLSRSSIYDSEMAKIEQNRQAELEANGCPAT